MNEPKYHELPKTRNNLMQESYTSLQRSRRNRSIAFLIALCFLSLLFVLVIIGKKDKPVIQTKFIREICDSIGKPIPVTITVYNPTPGQTDSFPFQTADGSIINPNKPQRWCAVSQDLLKLFHYGQLCWIDIPKAPYLNGIYEIHDTGNKRIKNHVDLLISNPTVCNVKGMWKGSIAHYFNN